MVLVKMQNASGKWVWVAKFYRLGVLQEALGEFASLQEANAARDQLRRLAEDPQD